MVCGIMHRTARESDAVVQSDAEVYDEMESDVAPETEALVPATYVEPDVVSEGK